MVWNVPKTLWNNLFEHYFNIQLIIINIWTWLSKLIYIIKVFKIILYFVHFWYVFMLHYLDYLYLSLGFSVAKATLQSQMSVRLSVRLKSKPLSLSESSLSAIMPIYWSLRYLSAIMPISYHAKQPPCPPPTQQLGQLAIIPVSHNYAYWPLYLLAICPAFATSKPFRLVLGHPVQTWKTTATKEIL